jgi:hypothetical protein
MQCNIACAVPKLLLLEVYLLASAVGLSLMVSLIKALRGCRSDLLLRHGQTRFDLLLYKCMPSRFRYFMRLQRALVDGTNDFGLS